MQLFELFEVVEQHGFLIHLLEHFLLFVFVAVIVFFEVEWVENLVIAAYLCGLRNWSRGGLLWGCIGRAWGLGLCGSGAFVVLLCRSLVAGAGFVGRLFGRGGLLIGLVGGASRRLPG